jgi:hypothetical protein
MNEVRRAQQMDSNGRLGVRRRAARALVANYILELSDRHAGTRHPRTTKELTAPEATEALGALTHSP